MKPFKIWTGGNIELNSKFIEWAFDNDFQEWYSNSASIAQYFYLGKRCGAGS